MIDISSKSETLRTAVAQAIIKVGSNGVNTIKKGKTPKGDVAGSSKVAALLAIKNTSHVLPHCHPIPVEYGEVEFEIDKNNRIVITVTVKTIYKTGCEMEALYGASVAALTAYDMIKPVDKDIVIENIRLIEKGGGKSDHKSYYDKLKLKSSILIISDSVYSGKSKDKSGKLIKEKLELFNVRNKNIDIVPDEADSIQNKIKQYCRKGTDLIVTTGGTGVSVRDVTYEAISPLIEKKITGIMEAARNFGQKRTPYAMLSRSVAGFIDETLVLTLPGSAAGVQEYLDALFPYVLHLFKVRKGFKHN